MDNRIYIRYPHTFIPKHLMSGTARYYTKHFIFDTIDISSGGIKISSNIAAKYFISGRNIRIRFNASASFLATIVFVTVESSITLIGCSVNIANIVKYHTCFLE